jgi:tetratricopeptide (TPR) repeat protein
MRRIDKYPVIILVLLVTIAGCAWSPEAKKARYTSHGDKYFSEAKYREAIIEYRNVLQIDGKNAHAVAQLGFAHFALGEMEPAFGFLSKARELAPDNLQVRVKLGTIYLIAKKPEEAHREAEFILEKDAKNLDGLLVLAGSANTSEAVDASLRRLEGALPDFADSPKFQIALGTLYLRKGDLIAAERAFKEAVSKDPKSVEAHTALGNLYVAKRDADQAEAEFKAAADLAPFGSMERVRLADLYLLIRKPDLAKNVLQETVTKAPEFLPAWQRTAQIALAEGRYDDALKALDPLFKKNQNDQEARLLRGRILLAQGKTDDAVREFQAILQLNPSAVQARIQLAKSYTQSGDVLKAKGELKEALTADPNSSEAGLILSELEIKTGEFQQAIGQLKGIIQNQPKLPLAHVLLGSAYFGKEDYDEAADSFREAIALAPKEPGGPYMLGQVLQASGKIAEARKQYEAAVVLAPAFADPLARLVALDFVDKKPDQAIDRIKLQISLAPQAATLHYLLGEALVTKGDADGAESAFNKAIEIEPRLPGAYVALSKMYIAYGREDAALQKLNEDLAKNPNDAPAIMLTGMIYQKKGNIAKAREAYEKVVALYPQFTAAANNLAYLYSSYGGDLEKAFQLALKAHEAAPEDPDTSDTLGWILYKRGDYQWALSLTKEASSKRPNNMEALFHLGMVQYKLNDNDSAEANLAKAFESGGDFPGAEEGREALKALGGQ